MQNTVVNTSRQNKRVSRRWHGETPFTAYQKRVGSQAGARGSSSLPRSGRTAVTGLSSPAAAARALRPLVLSAGSCAPGVSRLLPPPRRTYPPSRATRQQMMHVRSRCMCPSRARVFGVPASPYRLRLRPCLGSGVVERVVCGAGLSLGCLTGLVRSAVGGPSQPRPARESRRGFAHRFDLSTLPRFTRLRRAPRLINLGQDTGPRAPRSGAVAQ